MDYAFVIYKGEKFSLLHQYDSGYCEIKKDGASFYNIELVHISELTEVKEK
ncbi:MAG: hypothetical protein ACQEWV_32035 [Bacillota bacterium]